MPTSSQAQAKALDSEVVKSKPRGAGSRLRAKAPPRKDQDPSLPDLEIVSRRILIPVCDAVLAIVQFVTLQKKRALMVIFNRIAFIRWTRKTGRH